MEYTGAIVEAAAGVWGELSLHFHMGTGSMCKL